MASSRNIIDAFKGQTYTAAKFANELKRLGTLGLDKTYLSQLAQNGPSQTLDVLANSSKATIGQVSKEFERYQSTTAAAGSVAASTRRSPRR